MKIASRCVVIGSDGSPTTSQEIWQRPSPNSCSKMRPISPSRRCRNTYAQALERRCFSNDTSGGNRKLVLLFNLEAQSKDHKLCADATVEQPRKKNSPDYITYRSPKQTDLPISYNIAPSQKVLTIRFNPETRARTLDALQWGLIPYWVKDPNHLPDHQRPSSRPSIRRHHSVTIFHQLSRARNSR